MSTKEYSCKECNWTFELDMWTSDDDLKPQYCPRCGHKWEVIKTPTEIVEEIKHMYHSSTKPLGGGVEEEILKLIYKLKEMAER